MNFFLKEIQKGNFVTGKCKKCHNFVWPPSEFCSLCFGNVTWEKISKIGKLVEFSKKEDKLFGIGEFENSIKIVGKIKSEGRLPQVGQKILLEECKLISHELEFTFKLEKN